jgi:hypothetical protein
MAEKVIYEREVKSLTEADVQSAISYSRSRAIVGKVAEWRDRKTVGLTVRITPGKATWYVRRREITLRLGPVEETWGDEWMDRGKLGLDLARFVANQVHLASGRRRNLREFASTLIRFETAKKEDRYYDPDQTRNVEWADKFADETSIYAYRKRIGDTGITWTWKALTEKFLEYQLPKLKTRYREKYEYYLRLSFLICLKPC